MVEILYTIVTLIISVLVAMFNLPISTLIGLTGAFAGFIIVYLCPAKLQE